MDTLKAAARREVDRHAEELIRLSERLHADPETAWEEHRAAATVPELLDRAGFEVTSSYLGLDRAFLARFGSGPVRIALCAEYDALPGLGHACGHNLIAAGAVGAALGYETACAISLEAHHTGRPALDLVRERALLTEAELRTLTSPAALTGRRTP
ncbi:hypothetical protein ACQEV4_26900 [Streptomyces shenzhenensis]|uniref:hypothetical protein n=1 Tax=Streptomyces shenzhenensis TaxID=943815 RepID=UPI003D92810C